MATIKQCKMLAARSKAAGIDYDFESFKELDNGQVDEKIAEIERARDNIDAAEQKENTENTEFSAVRLGMAEKLVIQSKPLQWCIQKPTEFKKLVGELYQLLSEVEEEVSASSSSSSFTPSFSSDEEIAEYSHTLRAIKEHRFAVVCDYCGSVTQQPRSYQNATTLLCPKCAWFNSKDNKADSGLDEDTDPKFLDLELARRAGVA